MPENASQNLRPASQGSDARLGRRPPIVAVLGHVDHGKTTLLDFIRKANVAAREAGGITQSIGAYEITHNGKKMTFIDTPGHEAFISMRTRGASAADLAILVVAADEGVKPQTQESIRILNETKTPFVVAVTKMDKGGADIEKVKNELTAAGVLLEGFGGSVSFQPVSAKTGENVPELLDLLLLAAELENLTYDPAAPAEGYILESRMDRRRGTEASLIVRNGILRQGESIATKSGKGKIKILEDFTGKPAKSLEPCAPALVLGWAELPQVGEEFVTGEKANVDLAVPARKGPAPVAYKEEKSTLNIILKAADSGSLEALSQIVMAMASEKPLKLVSSEVGDVNDGDVKHAKSTNSIIFAFKSRVDKGAKTLAESNRVRIITADIIYELIQAIEEFLKKKEAGLSVGELEILAVFNQEKLNKQVVGGKVVKGVFRNKAQFEIERAGAKAGQGRVVNLQQQKKDASQVSEGDEAGLMVGSDTAIQVGDKLIIRN